MVKCTFPLCDRKFKSIKALNTHMRQAHPDWYPIGKKPKKK
jgi:hypothetical protein